MGKSKAASVRGLFHCSSWRNVGLIGQDLVLPASGT
jgi:hypothetical protein